MASSPARFASLLPPLSLAAPGALYQQIIDGIRSALARGQLHPGDLLPSVRQLAADTRVSVITVKRAYEELEREGLLHTRPGLGSFITESASLHLRQNRLTQAKALLAQARAEAERAGLSPAQIRALFLEQLTQNAQPNS